MEIKSEKNIRSRSFRLRRILKTEYGRIILNSIAVISAEQGKELTIDVRTYINGSKLICYRCTDTLWLLYSSHLDDTELMQHIALDYIKNPRGNFEPTPEEVLNEAYRQCEKEFRQLYRLFKLPMPDRTGS